MRELYTIRKDGFEIIPMAYNSFLNDLDSIKYSTKYAGSFRLDSMLRVTEIDALITYISSQIEAGPDVTFVIDMDNITLYPAREFEQFRKLEETALIFSNISIETVLPKLYIDLGGSFFREDEDEKTTFLFSDIRIRDKFYKKINSDIRQNYVDECARIVKEITRFSQPKKPQESSGVYSNCYVDIKKLLSKPKELNFIIFEMVSRIVSSNIKIDALVSTSRNGAALASILGWLLNMKVVHCVSIGPRYAIELDTIDQEIRKGKKYFYIFDFISLGTEAKILNALIRLKKADLVGGMGIANYIPFDTDYAKENVLGKMRSLVPILQYGIPYMIAGKYEDLEILMKEGRKP